MADPTAFLDDVLLKQYTPASFQRLLSNTNGHPEPAPQDSSKLFSTLGTDIETGEEIVISQLERSQALTCFGAIGSGKTNLAFNLLIQDVRQHLGVVLIEPHGDLTRHVLAAMPESRLDDVVYLDLIDCATFPFSINPFQCDTPQDAAEVAKIASFVQHTFERVWNLGPHTPLLAMVLRNITRTLIESPGSSFCDIPLLLHDDVAREKLVSNVSTLQTKLFWERYNVMTPRERRDLLSSTENKIDAYLNEPLIANILSQAHSSIDFDTLLNEGKIVLLNLSPQLEEISRLLGSLILGRILMSAYQRASVPESERIQCNVYVDEWSRFCSDDLAVLIAESRKFKVIIGGLFNQTLETVSDSNRATALQSGTLVTFRVSGDDSVVLARSYNNQPESVQTGVEPIRRPVFDVTTHLVRHGHTHPIVAQFTDEYLTRLDVLVKTLSTSIHPMEFCGQFIRGLTAAEGKQQLNQALFTCMESATADVFVPPLGLFILSCAAGDGSYHVFAKHLRPSGWRFQGLKESASQFGRADFLQNQRAVAHVVNKHAKKRLWEPSFRIITPGPSFIRMLRSLRQAMAVLAKEPVLTDSGLFQPVYRQRPFADKEAERANQLSSLPNYQAHVKLLNSEHIIMTHPAPLRLSEAEVNERIRYIKQRMRALGYSKSVQEVEAEVRQRHEWLRERNNPPPQAHTNGNRRRRNRPRLPDHP